MLFSLRRLGKHIANIYYKEKTITTIIYRRATH